MWLRCNSATPAALPGIDNRGQSESSTATWAAMAVTLAGVAGHLHQHK